MALSGALRLLGSLETVLLIGVAPVSPFEFVVPFDGRSFPRWDYSWRLRWI